MADNEGKLVTGVLGVGLGFLFGFLMRKKPPPEAVVFIEGITIEPEAPQWVVWEGPEYVWEPVTIEATVINTGPPYTGYINCHAGNELMSEEVYLPTDTPVMVSFVYQARLPSGAISDIYYLQQKVSVYVEEFAKHTQLTLVTGG